MVWVVSGVDCWVITGSNLLDIFALLLWSLRLGLDRISAFGGFRGNGLWSGVGRARRYRKWASLIEDVVGLVHGCAEAVGGGIADKARDAPLCHAAALGVVDVAGHDVDAIYRKGSHSADAALVSMVGIG